MSTSSIRDGGFSVTTRINAEPSAVYEAWTTKSGLEGWLATTAEVDARVGGRYVLRWPQTEGELSARGEYVELVPGERIVMTWESWGPEGRFEDGDATVQVDLIDRGGGSTEMTQTEASPSYTERSRIEMSIGGTIQAHEALVRFLEQDRR